MPYITSVERYGMEKGLEIGRQEGRQEGLEEGLQAGIAAVLTTKFGDLAKRLKARVRGIHDVKELHALLEFAQSAETLEEIRSRLPRRQG